MLTNEEVNEVMKIEGQVKGAVLQTDAEIVKKKWGGEEGLNKVKEELKKLGHPIEYEKVQALEWLPINLRVLSLLVVKDTLNLTDEDIKTMGTIAPKLSFIIKMIMRFFVSLKMISEKTGEFWSKYYSIGSLEADNHEEEKYVILTLKDAKFHSIMCKYLEGYFQAIVQFVVGENIKSEEIKCIFKGDTDHVYKVSWK